MTTYHVPRESNEGLGPFTVTENAAPDATFQISIHPYGVRPTTWNDSETVNAVPGCVNVGPSSAHWNALTQGRYRISVRDKETPAWERIGVATLYIT